MFEKPNIDRNALFCDETEDFRCPSEANAGDTVTFRFRTGRGNVDRVLLVEEGTGQVTPLRRESFNKRFDFYSLRLRMGEHVFGYYFRIVKGDEICYYNRLGVSDDLRDCFNFRVTPGFHVPEWARGAVMYQIYTDRFCNGDASNDVLDREYIYINEPVRRVTDWEEPPSEMDVRNFYGGDLQGVIDKLDYLQKLKVEAIYLNPIFVSPSNHKYDCQDYEHVDPHLGVIVRDEGSLVPEGENDNANAGRYACRTACRENLEASDRLLIRLIEEAHARGMKVLLDGVFNHCGSFNKWLDAERIYKKEGSYEPGAFESADSPYRTFFKFNDPDAWPDNASYDGWWGHRTLPKLNYEGSETLYQYVMEIARKWVSPPFNADGWRLDVAADLGFSAEFNHRFWRDFRRVVKEANPQAVVLAEHYGGPSSWLAGDQWDTVMNYDAFMEPVSWFLTGMEKHSDSYNGDLDGNGRAFFDTMKYHMSRMQTQSVQAAMNELSNHDHSRFLTRTNKTVGRVASKGAQAASEGINYGLFRAGVVMQMTWPGSPTIYYGDEAGVCGWTDPDNRRTYPWGKENLELIEFHCYLTGIRRRTPALRKGSVKELLAGKNIIAYGRFQGESRCVVIVNSGSDTMTLKVPVWQIGACDGYELVRVMLAYAEGYNAGTIRYPVRDGQLNITVGGYNSIILVAERLAK